MNPLLALTILGVTVTGAPGNARDWVGLFAHDAANTAYVDWVYVACDKKTCPNQSAPAGSTRVVHLMVPASLGLADIRLMSATGTPPVYQMLAQIDPDLTQR